MKYTLLKPIIGLSEETRQIEEIAAGTVLTVSPMGDKVGLCSAICDGRVVWVPHADIEQNASKWVVPGSG